MMVADSDVLIDFLRGREPVASRIALELRHGALRTTVISRFELLAGARGKRGEDAVFELLEAIPALPLTVTAADLAAASYRTLVSSGNQVPMADCLIAGIVLDGGHTLLTRNRKHFDRFSDLRLGRLEIEQDR